MSHDTIQKQHLDFYETPIRAFSETICTRLTEIPNFISESNANSRSPQSWYLPSSEVSAVNEDPDSGFESATPQIMSEDSQDALSNRPGNKPDVTRTEPGNEGGNEAQFHVISEGEGLSQEENSLLEDAVDLEESGPSGGYLPHTSNGQDQNHQNSGIFSEINLTETLVKKHCNFTRFLFSFFRRGCSRG